MCVYMRENKQTKVEARGRATCQSLRAPSIRTSGQKNIEEKNNKKCRRCFLHFKGHGVDSALLHNGPDLALSLHKKTNIIQNMTKTLHFLLLSSFSIEQSGGVVDSVLLHNGPDFALIQAFLS